VIISGINSERGACLDVEGVNEAYCCQIILTNIYQLTSFCGGGGGVELGSMLLMY
jgi:hypothetical protein